MTTRDEEREDDRDNGPDSGPDRGPESRPDEPTASEGKAEGELLIDRDPDVPSSPDDRNETNPGGSTATRRPPRRNQKSANQEPAVDGQSAPPPGGTVLPVLALVVALAALGMAAWLWWVVDQRDDTEGPEQFSALEEQLAVLEDQLARLDGRTGALDDDLDRVGERLDTLETNLDALDFSALEFELENLSGEMERQETRLGERMDQLGQALEEAVPDETRDTGEDLQRSIRLQEALALLRLGQDRMELAGDLPAARSAFSRAGQRLEDLDDPGLGSVRRQLARERENLQSHRVVDWADITGRLQALEAGVGEWPVREAELAELEVSEEGEPGWLARMGGTLGRLVEVRRREGEWLTPAEEEILKASIRSRLVAAEMAAARRDRGALTSSLDRVDEALAAWFDESDPLTEDARETMRSIREAADEETAPDLGEAARQLQTLLERNS